MKQDAASSIIAGAIESTALSQEEAAFFASEATAGITLFRRNIPQDQTCYQATSALMGQLQATRPAGAPPMIVAIDQEGGRVARMPKAHFPDLGAAQKVSAGGIDPACLAVLESYGMEVGRALLKAGVNVNFAPVLDILTEPTNTAIGDRVFGADAESVCRRAGAFLDGLQSTGILGCLKHFPGAIPQDEKQWQQALVEAVVAGTDLLLICRHIERCRLAIEALRAESAKSPAFTTTLETAASRVMHLRRQLATS